MAYIAQTKVCLIFVIEVILHWTCLAGADTFVLMEAEDIPLWRHSVTSRSTASGAQAIHLHQGDEVIFELCLTRDTVMQISEITCSNDGAGDTIAVKVDNGNMRGFVTGAKSDGGKGWNKFVSSGVLHSGVSISEGRHQITISVLLSDKYGVELDMMKLQFQDNVAHESIQCNVFCFDNIDRTDELNNISVTSAKIVQRSYHTMCAEEDNINIPVFHDTARRYIVTAHMPNYNSFSNSRGADWHNCKMTHAFWIFKHFNLKNPVLKISSERASMTSKWVGHKATVLVTFRLEGPITGSTDSEIGTQVHIKMHPLQSECILTFQYYNRYQLWSKPQQVTVSAKVPSATFHTPDDSFNETGYNKIRLEIVSPSRTVRVKEFLMKKRYYRPDASTEIYKDGVTIVEAVDMDMWWRINETMTVMTVHDGRLHSNVDYLRVYKSVPWSDNGFSQVFVIYQDGNVRLLPMTPHGLDWIPFGSSIVIGQTFLNSSRPSAPVRHIEIDPLNLELKIYYYDGGITNLQIRARLSETQLMISDSTYKRDLKQSPFITFRSMWVKDGNADVDRVRSDVTPPERIEEDWKSMVGTFFAFFRKCISKHNTLGPDITIKILA